MSIPAAAPTSTGTPASAPSAPNPADPKPIAAGGASDSAPGREVDAGQGRGPDGKFLPKQGEPPKAEKPAEQKKWKVKTRAGEREFSDPDEMAATLAETSSEAALVAEARKLLEREKLRKERIAAGDYSALKEDYGVDPTKMSVEHLKKLLDQQREEASLSPEAKKLKEAEAELARLRGEVEKNQKTKAEQELETHVKAERERIQKEISDVLEKTHLPRNEQTVRRIAKQLMRMEELGYELPPEAVAKRVEEQSLAEFEASLKGNDAKRLYKRLVPLLRPILAAASDDELLEDLGPDVSKKLRLADLKRLDPARFGGQAQNPQQSQENAPPESGRSTKQADDDEFSSGRMTQEEWDRRNKQRFARGRL